MRKKFWLSLFLVPVLALALACGGSDDDADDGDSGGGGGGSQPTAEATSSGGGGGGGSQPTSEPDDDEIDLEDCDAVESFVGGEFDPTTGEGFEFTPEFFQELADRAPDEIDEDMQVIADAFGDFFGLLEELNVDFNNPATFANLSAADQARLADASAFADSAEFQEASDNVTAYFEEKCG